MEGTPGVSHYTLRLDPQIPVAKPGVPGKFIGHATGHATGHALGTGFRRGLRITGHGN